MTTPASEQQSAVTPVTVHILESLFDDIKDTYPDFDQDKYRSTSSFLYPFFDTPSYDDENTDRTLDIWIREAIFFLDSVLLNTIGFSARLYYHKESETLSNGFIHVLVKKFSLESFFLDSKICCNQVLNEIRNSDFAPFRTPRTALFKSAIKATSALLEIMRILDYARIADRHLQIRKLKDAITGDEPSVKEAVETVQQALDSNEISLTDEQRKELDRILYNAARKQGILPSKFYVNNVQRLGEYCFGGGSYGDVYKGQIDQRLVAVKVSRFSWNEDEGERLRRELCKEALIWQRLDHTHILPFLGLCKEGFPSIGLVSPFMKNGDVLAYLKRNPQADKKELTRQIGLGLEYMHCNEPEVIHGDLRCANVLIDDGGNPCIADFGLARLIGIATLTTNSGGRGTLRWQAPELIHPTEYGGDGQPNVKTDVYAFGMTCLEIFTEKPPFHGTSDWEVIRLAGNGIGLERALAITHGPEYLIQILRACCSTNPNSRMNMWGMDDIIFAEWSHIIHSYISTGKS